MLGLFDHSDLVISAPINNWLRVADELINDKVDADDVVRKACRHLSSHDFLADKEIPTLSDYVLSSLVNKTYLPNNVELWVNRMQ